MKSQKIAKIAKNTKNCLIHKKKRLNRIRQYTVIYANKIAKKSLKFAKNSQNLYKKSLQYIK